MRLQSFSPGVAVCTLLAGSVLACAQAPPRGKPGPDAGLTGRVKELFRNRCLSCHGGARKAGRLDILNRDLLVNQKKLIIPGKPDDSELFQRISSTEENERMPEPPREPLKADEIELVRKWIVAGAPDFPADVAVPAEPARDVAFEGKVGIDHVLRHILDYVRQHPDDRRFVRFFSFNHILTAGATAEELTRQREALVKAINHLSWEDALYQPVAIDPPANTVYAVDLRKLGWHLQPFRCGRGKDAPRSPVNLFDLVLLEYPYGIAYRGSDLFARVAEEFLEPAAQVRPIAYLRSDWFVSTATLPPLYEDILRLPFTVSDLERRLGVDAAADLDNGRAWRAGLTLSGVSRNNRVVERHPAGAFAYYWKSLDFRSSKGPENMFQDPIHLQPAGGEMIFGLPNGLQGYFVANGRGQRLDAAPTDIVSDKFASDRVVRNGLSCMRCHDQGMKDFKDTLRPALLKLPDDPGFDKRRALDLYPEKDLEEALSRDRTRFQTAMKQLLTQQTPPGYEPLVPVTRRFLDDSLSLAQAAGELGLPGPSELAAVFASPRFTALGLIPLTNGGVVRRDAWEDYFDQVVQELGLGVPLPPLDGLLRRDFPAGKPPLDVELKTNHANNLFRPGDELVVEVVNRSAVRLHIELVGTGPRGEKAVLTTAGLTVAAGQTYRFPPSGGIKFKGELGKEQLTLLASPEPFDRGEELIAEKRPGEGVTDRVIHKFERLEKKDGVLRVVRPTVIVKKTIEIESR